MHMEKAAPFPQEILRNTVHPHNAFCPHLPASCLSAGKAKYHVVLHPLLLYNAHRLLQQDRYLSLRACEAVPDSLPAAPEFHDPVIQERNFLFRKCPDNAGLLPLHPHTFLSGDIWQPHRQGRHLVQ